MSLRTRSTKPAVVTNPGSLCPAPWRPGAGSIGGRAFDALPPAAEQQWDNLVPAADTPLKVDFFRAWQRCELPGLRPRSILAYGPRGNGLAGACPAHWYDLDLLGTRFPATAGAISAVRRVVPGFGAARTYEIGCPAPLVDPFLVDGSRSRGSVVKALIRAALDEADSNGAQFVLVQSFTSLDCEEAEQLRLLGFAAVPMLPTVLMNLPFGSFDDYLSAMRAQYRRRALKVLRQSEGLRIEHLQRFDDLSWELAALWRLIFDRATEVKREILTPAFFRGVSHLDESSVLLARRPDGSIVSFALLLTNPPWMTFLHCGFDAEAGQSDGAYFRLLYEIVRLAIEKGVEQVELGLTTLAPKLDIGGVPVPLFAFIKHRNPLVQRAMRWLANGPMGPPEVAPRRVFKEPPPPAADLVARRPRHGGAKAARVLRESGDG